MYFVYNGLYYLLTFQVVLGKILKWVLNGCGWICTLDLDNLRVEFVAVVVVENQFTDLDPLYHHQNWPVNIIVVEVN